MTKEKIGYIEWLRVLAAFSVVGIHITMTQPNNFSVAEIGRSNYMVLTSVYAMVQWAVPVFLMITGNLLLHSNTLSWGKVRKMIGRMSFVLLIFGCSFALIEQVFNEKTIGLEILPRALLLTLEQKSWSHLWYLYVLIGIYFIIIPIKKFVDNSSYKEVCLITGILVIGNFIVPTINMAFNTDIVSFMILTQYVAYIFLGYIIGGLPEDTGESKLKKMLNSLSNRGVLFGLWCAAATIKIVIQCLTVLNTGEGVVLFLDDKLFTLIQALTVYCLFKKYNGKPLGRISKCISSCSFGIYLIHPVFINLLYKAMNITPTNFPGGVVCGIILLWAVVFLFSWGTTWVMKKMPVFSRII